MAVKYGEKVRYVGSSARPIIANGAHNFERVYYKHNGASGDVRGKYEDLDVTSTGSGEMLRIRGIASGTLVATGGTVNAIHATGRVASGGTVSGALNAIRATLEVAGTTPTPGGTLAALQLDVNASATTTWSTNDAFIRVTNSGSTMLPNLLNLPAAGAASAYLTDLVVSNHDTAAPATWNYAIGIRIGGTKAWIPVTTDTPND